MLIFIYNILQLVILVLFWPLVLLGAAVRKKYRSRFTARLGIGLAKKLPVPAAKTLTFWVHALSVGEVTSAVPLISGIRERWPDSRIVVTATTTSGFRTANTMLRGRADFILSSPVDIRPVISRFIRRIDPDIYIQVETDFWPNQLQMLDKADIPSVLVNGRISEQSYRSYKRYSFFFRPMFLSFNHLCMQTEKDRLSMMRLGVPENSLHTLGNLKFDTQLSLDPEDTGCSPLLPTDSFVITAGSTHPGEEELLLSAFCRLRQEYPDIYPVIVPRNPARAEEIRELAAAYDLHAVLKTQSINDPGDLLIVDTIGDLIGFYRCCRIAIVGGSFVPEGGHNPIEPALFSVPVIFGNHMEDFSEIAADLQQSGGAVAVSGLRELEFLLRQLLGQSEKRNRMGNAASACIENRKGVIQDHLELMNSLL